MIETVCISDSEDDSTHEDDNDDSAKKRKCLATSTQEEIKLCSPAKKSRRMVADGSPYLSHPVTPPDDDVVEPRPIVKHQKFIPGNINIDDILNLCSTDIKEKEDNIKSAEKPKLRSNAK